MRSKDIRTLAPYQGEVFTQDEGSRRVYKGCSDGPINITVDGVLYGHSMGGDFVFEVIAPYEVDVAFEAVKKDTRLSLTTPDGPTVQVHTIEDSWTREEPRPAVNPQLAALMASIRHLEMRLSHKEQQAAHRQSEPEVVEDPAEPIPAEAVEEPASQQ